MIHQRLYFEYSDPETIGANIQCFADFSKSGDDVTLGDWGMIVNQTEKDLNPGKLMTGGTVEKPMFLLHIIEKKKHELTWPEEEFAGTFTLKTVIK